MLCWFVFLLLNNFTVFEILWRSFYYLFIYFLIYFLNFIYLFIYLFFHYISLEWNRSGLSIIGFCSRCVALFLKRCIFIFRRVLVTSWSMIELRSPSPIHQSVWQAWSWNWYYFINYLAENVLMINIDGKIHQSFSCFLTCDQSKPSTCIMSISPGNEHPGKPYFIKGKVGFTQIHFLFCSETYSVGIHYDRRNKISYLYHKDDLLQISPEWSLSFHIL